jgi:uncharacterized RDD family membrane protein YckC
VIPAIGVYFKREDYASFWIRVLVSVIDLLACGALCLASIIPVSLVSRPSGTIVNLILLMWVAIAFSYFVILKRSRFRTLGYRLAGVRTVGLDGCAPSYSSLTLRLMFAVASPLSGPIDFVWIANDINRQALRDKFSRSYVVRTNALPAGTGRIGLRHYDIWGLPCLFREVEIA